MSHTDWGSEYAREMRKRSLGRRMAKFFPKEQRAWMYNLQKKYPLERLTGAFEVCSEREKRDVRYLYRVLNPKPRNETHSS